MQNLFDVVSVREAAYLSGIGYREMNRAIDERILPDSAIINKGGRRVVALACALTRFYFQTAPALSADFRRRIVGWMAEQLLRKSVMRVADPSRESMVFREGQIRVDVAPFVEQTLAAFNALRGFEAKVVIDPEILAGEPVLKGTRVPARVIAKLVKAGEATDALLEAYPSLTAAAVAAAVAYVETHPLRGRPSGMQDLPPSARVASRRVVRSSAHRKAG